MDNWNKIYSKGEQLNAYPYSELVAFFFRRKFKTRKGFKVLDVGCGSGVHSFFCANNGGHIVAVDGSFYAIEEAKKRFYHPRIEYVESNFDSFNPGRKKFDLILDRCSTSQNSPKIIQAFYKKIQRNLNPGAWIFWQGFCLDNSGRSYGIKQKDGSWNNFSGGVFKQLGTTSFLSEAQVREIFIDYDIKSLRRIGDLEVKSGYDHSTWIVEALYGS